MHSFVIYIFSENQKITEADDQQDIDYLNEKIKYVKVDNMDEVKEDLLNRRFSLGAGEYGIMLAPNKCRIQNFYCGFDNHYILDEYLVEELGLLSIGHIDTLGRIDYHMEREHGKGCYDMRLTQNSNNLRVFRYDNRRLNIDYTKVKYIDVTSADEIKEDLLTSNGYEYLDTYIILTEDIKIKNKKMGYKNYKVITEKEIEDRMEDILKDGYDIEDKTIIVFTINATFDSHKNFKSVQVSNIDEMKETFNKLSEEADEYTFQRNYCYLIFANEEIRLYDTKARANYKDEAKNKWVSEYKYSCIVVDIIKDLGFSEMNSVLRTIRDSGGEKKRKIDKTLKPNKKY